MNKALLELANSISTLETAIAAPLSQDPRTASAWEVARGEHRGKLSQLLDRNVSELCLRAKVLVEVGSSLRSVAPPSDCVVDCWSPYKQMTQELALSCGSPQAFDQNRVLQLMVGIRQYLEASHYARLAALYQAADLTGPLFINNPNEGGGGGFINEEQLLTLVRDLIDVKNPEYGFSRIAVLDALRSFRPSWKETPRVLVVGARSTNEALRLCKMFSNARVVTKEEFPDQLDADFYELLHE